MAELGFASAILKLTTGSMADVSTRLATTGRGVAESASPLELFTAHVHDAQASFTHALGDGQFSTLAPDQARGHIIEGLRNVVSSLEAAHAQPVRHEAMGHADAARQAASNVIRRLEAVPPGTALEQPAIGSPIFQDLWGAKHGLSEAGEAAGRAHVLNNWRAAPAMTFPA
jgi:hypothetical protein